MEKITFSMFLVKFSSGGELLRNNSSHSRMSVSCKQIYNKRAMRVMKLYKGQTHHLNQLDSFKLSKFETFVKSQRMC